jgi:hypothetical protein
MLVTLSMPGPEGAEDKHLIWVSGWTLRDYLRETRNIALNLHCRTTTADGRVVRMNYVPKPGDHISLRRTRQIA